MEVAAYPEFSQKIVEGIDKFLLRRIPATNFFQFFSEWTRWLHNNTGYIPNITHTLSFINRFFLRNDQLVSELMKIKINFTEISNFPVRDENEYVEATKWRRENTKCYALWESGDFRDLTSLFTEEIDEPEIGRSFSIQIEKTHFKFSYKQNSKEYVYCMLVFVYSSKR